MTSFRLLVYSRTTGYRHDSIPAGIAALRALGAAHDFEVDATEDPAAFTVENLARYRVVVFLSTSGTVLEPSGRAALESFVRSGGGFVGVHAAAGTEYDWPFYEELVGAYFDRHPHIQPGVIHVVDRDHPATASLPTVWRRTDEWYDFRSHPQSRPASDSMSPVRVLMTVDESSYTGGGMGADHPIAWCRQIAAGRSFYTAIGHAIESYAEPEFRAHLAGGIRYAAGLADRQS